MYRSLGTLACALSILSPTLSYAGHIDDVIDPEVNVTIPQQDGQWTFGIEALYLKCTDDDFHYASTSTMTGTPVMYTDSHRHYIDHHFDWGWKLDATYEFAGNGRFGHIAWEHVCGHADGTKDGNRSTILAGPAIMAPAGIGTAPTQFLPTVINPAVGWDTLTGKSESTYNAVDITFGQRMFFADRVELAPFVGVRYASIDTTNRIKSDVTINQVGTNAATGVFKADSDYCGMGPRCGVDVHVLLSKRFAITGEFGASVLVGDADAKSYSNIMYTANGVTAAGSIQNTFRQKSQTKVVPELDARLGVAFHDHISVDSSYALEIGFHAENYFSALNTSQYSYFDTAHHENDFSHFGPYFRAEFSFT